MAQKHSDEPITWDTVKDRSVSEFPTDLADRLQENLPAMRGYWRRVMIALTSMYVCPSCPPEARQILLDWVDTAQRDESQREPSDLALRVAEAIIRAHNDSEKT